MITLEVHNHVVKVFNAPLEVVREIDKATSYLVEGYYFAPSFRSRAWDGREKLLKQNKSCVWTYAGLVIDVANAIRDTGHSFNAVDKTFKAERRELVWNAELDLRQYQARVIDALMKTPFAGIGTLVMPIRSGKTRTAAGVIRRIGRSTLMIVPSKMLLYQTAAVLQDCFPHESIGLVGDSEFNLEFITVATVQSLNKYRELGGERWLAIIQFNVMILDECHHARGGGDWHKVFVEIQARYRVGLSATLFNDSNVEQARGIIWAKAACGPIRARVETKELVEQGFLMKQNVTMYKVRSPEKYKHMSWSATIAQKCVHENKTRNVMIAKLCSKFAAEGRRIVVCCNRLNHIAALVDELQNENVDCRTITGSDSRDTREQAIHGLNNLEYHVLIGTVLREGVDLPCVDVVINAEGGKDAKNAVQRQRNLTISPGKTEAIFIDFIDEQNKVLLAHSKKRLKQYQLDTTTSIVIKDFDC